LIDWFDSWTMDNNNEMMMTQLLHDKAKAAAINEEK
jgi:hypothetical protein